jgi:hypothetical protein
MKIYYSEFPFIWQGLVTIFENQTGAEMMSIALGQLRRITPAGFCNLSLFLLGLSWTLHGNV